MSLVATTVAHEMGHNFGMEHDNDTQCSCLEDKCIMSATSGYVTSHSTLYLQFIQFRETKNLS